MVALTDPYKHQRAWRQRNKSRVNAYNLTWRIRNGYKPKHRQTVIHHYGGKCAVCGESNSNLLVIDHIHDDGATHRREIGQSAICMWLVDNGFPDGFQVLCHNHNQKKEADRRWSESTSAKWERSLRRCVLQHYGGKCAECGIDDQAVLHFDHIGGGGRKHKAEVGPIHRWLKKAGFPEGFQVLCANHNHLKRLRRTT